MKNNLVKPWLKIIKCRLYFCSFLRKGKKDFEPIPNCRVLYCKNIKHALKLLSQLFERGLLETENETLDQEIVDDLAVSHHGHFQIWIRRAYDHEHKHTNFKAHVDRIINFYANPKMYVMDYIGNNVLQVDGYCGDFDDQINYLIETYKINCEVLNE